MFIIINEICFFVNDYKHYIAFVNVPARKSVHMVCLFGVVELALVRKFRDFCKTITNTAMLLHNKMCPIWQNDALTWKARIDIIMMYSVCIIYNRRSRL